MLPTENTERATSICSVPGTLIEVNRSRDFGGTDRLLKDDRDDDYFV